MTVDLKKISEFLKSYDGERIRVMEVCGSHTAAIAKSGIKDIISERIELISGPGCPVCVTTSAYVDRLIELSKANDIVIVTFGDMLRIPGSKSSLAEAKGEGAEVIMVYSPMDIIALADKNPNKTFIFAAVGFETTTPAYALLIDKIVRDNIKNIKLLTALKTMPAVIEYLLDSGAEVDAFLAPGHVSVVTGYKIFEPIAVKYAVPFGVAGFSPEELMVALCGLVKHLGCGVVRNYYPAVVTEHGNEKAKELVSKYFEVADAAWHGMGVIDDSGLVLKDEYAYLDVGSEDLMADEKKNPACSCDRVLMGKIYPTDCPLFGKGCTPEIPKGACMVSEEGSCHTYYMNK